MLNLQAQLLAALNCAGDAIEITDAEGRLLYVNKAFESQTGYLRQEALGKTPGELLRSGYHSDLHYESIWSTISQGRLWGGELYRRRKDSTIAHMEVRVSPFLDGAGEVTHYIAVSRDISVRKAAEEERAHFEQQIQHSHRLESIGRLAGVAHDFNNILTGIMGYVELMMGDLESVDREDLEEILRAARRGSELTRQLLAFGRKQTISPKHINANDSLVMSQRILGEDIALKIERDTSLWNILADPGQLEQILIPRAVNSEVELSAQRGHETVLIVEDEEMIRRLMRRLLEDRGYTVLSASDAQSAIELFEALADEVHLGIFDIVMPGMDGHELSLKLAVVAPDLKVLFMSGDTPEAIAGRGVNKAESNFISKPFTTGDLLEKVRAILDA